jgi:hypothetical protein
MELEKPKRELSQAALCAKAIRKELKEKFPGVKFEIRSSNFSNGNSVDIKYVDGPGQDKIRQIAEKYQSGYFNGSIDCYEYTKHGDDLPRSKYVFVKREFSPETLTKQKKQIGDKFGIGILEENTWYKQFNCYGQEVLYREITNKDF